MRTSAPALCLTALVMLCAISMSINAQAPARVSGVLIELNKPGTIEVSLSVGADDGLRVGDKLSVARDGQVLGTVEVVKTFGAHSTAKIIQVRAGRALSKNDAVKSL